MSAHQRPLTGSVAVVAGATRGAGRGIARGLGEAGATVYCTGRSTTGNPSPYKRKETIDETAEQIRDAGGNAISVRVDHTVESEVEALFKRVVKEQGGLDVLVNSIAGEDPRGSMSQWCSFWKTKLDDAELTFRQSLLSHIITAKHAVPCMIEKKRGLIVEVSENDGLGAGGNPITQTVKLALKSLALNLAAELRPYSVSVVSVTPGFLRSETMLERFRVTEANWRDGGKKDKNFLESETPLFLGRGVAALAADPATIEQSGMLFSSWELGRKYGLTDADGNRPDWGAHTIDFSGHPKSLIDLLRIGSDMQIRWLQKLTANAEILRKKLPESAAR